MHAKFLRCSTRERDSHVRAGPRSYASHGDRVYPASADLSASSRYRGAQCVPPEGVRSPLMFSDTSISNMRMWRQIMADNSPLRSCGAAGFSLLETLVALALGSMLLAGVFTIFSRSLAAISLASAASESLTAAAKAHAILASGYTASARSRLHFVISTFSGSALSTSDGAPHPLTGLRPTSAPRSDSDIITFIALYPQHRGRIRSWRRSGTAITFEVCDIFKTPRPDEYKSIVILSLDGPLQAVGDLAAISTECAAFSGTIIKGLIAQDTSPRGSPLEAIAVASEQSVFIDRSGELRLVSHVGMRILENQPLARGFRYLRFESNTSAGIITHAVEIKLSAGPRYRGLLLPSASPRAVWNEVLP